MSNDKQASVRKPSRRSLLLILSVVGAAALIALAAIGRETRLDARADSAATIEPVLRVDTQVVRAQEAYDVERSFVGRVEAARSSDLGFELAGLVDRVLVDEGDRVAAGQRLAVLDRQRLRSRRGELTAALDEARADRDLAYSTHDRVAEAAELDAVSDQEHDEARLALRAREATVRQLEAQIRSLDVELAKSTLAAPYPAVVAARLVDEGEVLAAGQPVLRLLEAGRPEARIGTTPEQAEALSPGDAVDVVVRGRTYPTRVKAILPDREPRTRTVTVLLAFEDSRNGHGAAVRDGDLAEVVLSQSISERGFWLPASALTESVRGLWACLVVEPDAEHPELRRIARRDVEVLHTETDRVFVRGTLQDGERVVAGGVHRLVPGQLVTATQGGVAS